MVNKIRLVLLFGSIYQHFTFVPVLPVFVVKNNVVQDSFKCKVV